MNPPLKHDLCRLRRRIKATVYVVFFVIFSGNLLSAFAAVSNPIFAEISKQIITRLKIRFAYQILAWQVEIRYTVAVQGLDT